MKTKDFKVGDKVKIRNSITGTIMEITGNGWIKVVWVFHNRGRLLGVPETEINIDGFRASDIESIIEREAP